MPSDIAFAGFDDFDLAEFTVAAAYGGSPARAGDGPGSDQPPI